MIQDYPHAEINEGAELLPRRRRGLRAELARALATRPVVGVAACFVLGLVVGGAVTVGALKAADALRNGRSVGAPDKVRSARVLRFPKGR